MAYLRLFRRVRIAPGLTMNLTKAGPSLSVGVRGAHVTVGRSGIRRTVGLPGSGVFWTATDGRHTGAHTGQPFHEAASPLSTGGRILHAVTMFLLTVLLCVVALAILGLVISR